MYTYSISKSIRQCIFIYIHLLHQGLIIVLRTSAHFFVHIDKFAFISQTIKISLGSSYISYRTYRLYTHINKYFFQYIMYIYSYIYTYKLEFESLKRKYARNSFPSNQKLRQNILQVNKNVYTCVSKLM